MATWSDYVRKPIWLVKLELDECSLTFGTGACTATGTPCYYTYPTCRSPLKADYVKSSKVLYFSSAQGPVLHGVLPLVKDVQVNQTKLDHVNTLTTVGQFKIVLADTDPLPWANPGKAADAAVQNRETAGTFLLNLKARNPNYKRRAASIYIMLQGQAVSQATLVGKGVIDNISEQFGEVEITVKDSLKLLERKVPASQTSANALTAVYDAGATMYVTDASQFMDPADFGGKKQTVKVDDAYYVTYTGLTTGGGTESLTGCVSSAWGTTGASAAIGAKVKNVCVVADPDEVAGSWAAVAGMPPDYCLGELLCTYGGISFSDLATADSGAVLDGAIADSDLTFTVDDGTALPYRGVAYIGIEAVCYSSRAGEVCTVPSWGRGMFGTTAAAHDDQDAVYLWEASVETDNWHASSLFKRRWEEPASLKDLLSGDSGLRAAGKIRVWQGEDSKVHVKMAPICSPLESPAAFSETSGLAADPAPSINDREEERKTRVTVFYGPNTVKPSKEAQYWDGCLFQPDVDLEAPNNLDAAYEDVFWNPWIYREAEALLMAKYHLIWYRSGPKELTFALDVKDAQDLDVGDFVRATTEKVVSKTGEPREGVLYEVLTKKRIKGEHILYQYTAMDMSGGEDGKRYCVISPASLTHDYDSATAEEKARYGFVGSNDVNNTVGADADPGDSIL